MILLSTQSNRSHKIILAAMLPRLLIQIHLAPSTNPSARLGGPLLFPPRLLRIIGRKRRQLVPNSNLHVAGGDPLLISPHDLHSVRDHRRRRVRRVERRKSLLTDVAVKAHHPRHHRVHRLHRAQRGVAQGRVVLNDSHRHFLRGHHHVLRLQEPRQTTKIQSTRPRCRHRKFNNCQDGRTRRTAQSELRHTLSCPTLRREGPAGNNRQFYSSLVLILCTTYRAARAPAADRPADHATTRRSRQRRSASRLQSSAPAEDIAGLFRLEPVTALRHVHQHRPRNDRGVAGVRP